MGQLKSLRELSIVQPEHIKRKKKKICLGCFIPWEVQQILSIESFMIEIIF